MLAMLLLGFTAVGAPANAGRVRPEVIGGTDVSDNEYPFVAALLNEKRTGTDFDKQFCGGTLIAPTWVLTAAHCVTNSNGRPISARNLAVAVGRTVLSSSQGERFAVREIRVHPQYATASWISHDAALLRLSGTSTRTPVQLATAANDNLEAAGTTLTVAGWGTTCYPGSCWPDRMQEVNVPVVSDADCTRAYGSTDLHAPTSVCAGAEGIDTCSGDSGGPMFSQSSGFVQVGITSWGEGCALAGWPGVYAEVNNPDVRGWITANAGV